MQSFSSFGYYGAHNFPDCTCDFLTPGLYTDAIDIYLEKKTIMAAIPENIGNLLLY
jgi:hypothetical protein